MQDPFCKELLLIAAQKPPTTSNKANTEDCTAIFGDNGLQMILRDPQVMEISKITETLVDCVLIMILTAYTETIIIVVQKRVRETQCISEKYRKRSSNYILSVQAWRHHPY